MSENEIGVSFQQKTKKYRDSQDGITGIGCNTGIVTGTARVVEDITQIDQLKAGDILVTKFTDTGWTSRMAILSGIVTERGGVLCHASIIAREYGIPCIVSCYDVTKLIPNGSQITINGETGEVLIHK
jgi:pyruvate,water dikinase